MSLKSCCEMRPFSVTCWATPRRISTMCRWKRATMISNRRQLWRKSGSAFWPPCAVSVLFNSSDDSFTILSLFSKQFWNPFDCSRPTLKHLKYSYRINWDFVKIYLEKFVWIRYEYEFFFEMHGNSLGSLSILFRIQNVFPLKYLKQEFRISGDSWSWNCDN